MIWKCGICDHILSKAGYINHLESHKKQPSHAVPPLQPGDNVCVICHKICKSVAGLKRHMIVHKETDITAWSNQSCEDMRIYLSSMFQAMQVSCWFEKSTSWPFKKRHQGAGDEMLMRGIVIIYENGTINIYNIHVCSGVRKTWLDYQLKEDQSYVSTSS